MKLHILSDLHLEFARFHPPTTDADVVVLAGDIHLHTHGITWAREAFPDREVICLAGNHEFYGAHWIGLLEELRGEAERCHVHFLEDNAIVLGGVRFLGCCLWTDFNLYGSENRLMAERTCRHTMADFSQIRVPAYPIVHDPARSWMSTQLTPGLVRDRHIVSRDWLQEQLASPFGGKTVVVTHHLPSMLSVADRFRRGLTSAGFASNLDHLLGPAALWIHGHTHDSFNYVQNGTRILCNPRGYPVGGGRNENRDFDPGLTVEV
jgi:predicted phosphodiesterase